MAAPCLIINGHDYAQYIEELTPSRNDLDAEGSGRDVQTGLMYRTRISQKRKWDVKFSRLSQTLMQQLAADIDPVFFQATMVDPTTGAQVTKYYYVSTLPFGAQRYNKESGAPVYDGVSFSMTER